jgi:hypothetical protein
VLPPLHATLVWDEAVALKTEGCVMVTETVVALLALSVMVTM